MCTKARVLLQQEKKEDQGQGIEEISQEEVKGEEEEKLEDDISEVKKEDSEDELVNEDLSLIKKANSWTEAKAPAMKTDEQELEYKQKYKIIKLNYIMNELKNMKVAKTNAKRPMTVHRSETNDTNIQYELNSGIYLVIKEEVDNMTNGYTWSDNDQGVKMIIESRTPHKDKAENITQTTIKWKVIDEKSKIESKVAMLLYHTNQGVHLQGGRRYGQVTTCSLAADMFETFCILVMRDKSERIKMIKEVIMGMDLRTKPFQVASRLMVKAGPEAKNSFKCNTCPYKSTKLSELKRHMYILHRNRKNPEASKMTKAKKRAGSPTKAERPSKKESEEKASPVKTPEPEEHANVNLESIECLECKFSCEKETNLDKHMEEEHRTGRGLEIKVNLKKDESIQIESPQTDETKNIVIVKKDELKFIADVITIEMVDEAIKKAATEKEKVLEEFKQENKALMDQVELMKLKMTSLATDLKLEREAIKEVRREKENVEKNYQEAARAIAEQQTQITIREEQIKVLGELINIEEETQAQTTSEETKGDGWDEVYEDVTKDGDLLLHQEKSMVTLGCKKCDKKVKSDKELREHMKIHRQLQNKDVKCGYCDFISKDENVLINHTVDNHSPKYTCETCKLAFSSKPKLLEHIVRVHGFIFDTHSRPEPDIQCHDCTEKFTTKPDLIKHRMEKHHKTRLCPFFHGNGRGCKFPSNVCFNIHEENITPTETETLDFRKRIFCKNGDSCVFYQRNICFYKHNANNVNTNKVQQGLSRNTYAEHTAQNFNQKYKCMKCNEEFNFRGDFEHHMRTNHRESENDILPAIRKIGQQIESVSQRLQFLELRSMSDFPPLEKGQQKI